MPDVMGKTDTRVWDAIRLKVDGMFKSSVAIGFLDAGVRHAGSDITVLELALIHELGTAEMPERSFIRRTFEIRASELGKVQGKLMAGVLSGKITYEKALDLLGAWGANEIKQFVKSDQVTPPTTAAATARKNARAGKAPDAKGTTLVDTGQLVNAITWQVRQ